MNQHDPIPRSAPLPKTSANVTASENAPRDASTFTRPPMPSGPPVATSKARRPGKKPAAGGKTSTGKTPKGRAQTPSAPITSTAGRPATGAGAGGKKPSSQVSAEPKTAAPVAEVPIEHAPTSSAEAAPARPAAPSAATPLPPATAVRPAAASGDAAAKHAPAAKAAVAGTRAPAAKRAAATDTRRHWLRRGVVAFFGGPLTPEPQAGASTVRPRPVVKAGAPVPAPQAANRPRPATGGGKTPATGSAPKVAAPKVSASGSAPRVSALAAAPKMTAPRVAAPTPAPKVTAPTPAPQVAQPTPAPQVAPPIAPASPPEAPASPPKAPAADVHAPEVAAATVAPAAITKTPRKDAATHAAPTAPRPPIPAPPRPAPPTSTDTLPQPVRTQSWGAAHRGALLSLIPVYVLVALLGVSATVALVGTQAGSAPAASEQAAAQWLVDNASTSEPLIVDAGLADALEQAGWNPDDLFVYGSTDAGTSVEQPTSWRDVAYVVTTVAARTVTSGELQTSQAIDNSVQVASFGSGVDVVEVRMVAPEGASLAAMAEQQAAATRSEFGSQLAQNATVRMTDADRAALAAGTVDERISAVLGTLAAAGDVEVAGFPVIPGEADRPLRQVAITAIDGVGLVASGQITPETSALLAGLRGEYAPQSISVDGAGVVLRYPTDPAN